MRLVRFEAKERQRANIDLFLPTGTIAHRQPAVEAARALAIIAKAVLIVLAGDVSGKGIAAIRPPERCTVIRIKPQDLLWQRLPAEKPALRDCGRGD
jgi:hypothetical protein